MQKQKTRSRKAEETAQAEAKAPDTNIDMAAIDKLLDEIDAGIEEEEERKNEALRLSLLEKLRSIQTPRQTLRRDPCWCGGAAGDYEYVPSVY